MPVESFDVPTRFGQAHIQACGPKEAPPLVLRPGAGHALNFDQPERVNHRILDF